MSIGVLGPVTFEVNDKKVRTWQELKRQAAARWATHDVYKGKPVKEFLGPGLIKLDLQVRIDSQLGLAPSDELKQLRQLEDTGAVNQFTVGPELIGDFVILGLDEEHRYFSRTGDLLLAIVSLSLEEYA